MKRMIMLDAYNFIFFFHDYKSMKNEYLSALRDQLISDMDEYGKYTDTKMVIVFDGHFSQRSASAEERKSSLRVIYSKKGQSADSIIEKLSKNMQDYDAVFVVSSDYDQQKVIFKDNVYRKSIREFKLELDSFKKDIEIKIREIKKQPKNVQFNQIGKMIDKDVLKKLLRLGKLKE
jgi:uncharacterized protein